MPEPAQLCLGRAPVDLEPAHRGPAHRHRLLVVAGERGERVEQEVDALGVVGSRVRRGPRRRRHVAHVDELVEPGPEQGCGERVHVRLAGQVDVQGLQASCCRQQRAGRVVAAGGHEHQLGTEELALCALTLLDRATVRDRQQPASGLERARLDVRERGIQGAAAAVAPVPASAPSRGSGTRRPRRRPRVPVPVRPSARALRRRPRPGPTVARARCQARRSGSVSASVAVARAWCTWWRCSVLAVVVGRGAGQRVGEADPVTDLEQARRRRPGGRR